MYCYQCYTDLLCTFVHSRVTFIMWLLSYKNLRLTLTMFISRRKGFIVIFYIILGYFMYLLIDESAFKVLYRKSKLTRLFKKNTIGRLR